MSVRLRGWIVAAELNDEQLLALSWKENYMEQTTEEDENLIEFLIAWCWIGLNISCMTVIRM